MSSSTTASNDESVLRAYIKEARQEQDEDNTNTKLVEFVEPKSRSQLPSEMFDRSKLSVWSILKQCVDKELYRFTVPIIWNEPLSLLQRIAESMRYAPLLDRAASASTSVDRLKFVTAYVISTQSLNAGRISKPFNPLLGETYELVSTKHAYRICCEQVSHHPPVTAFHAESIRPNSRKWAFYGSDYPNVKLNILHGCIEAIPEGVLTVELADANEAYSWQGIRVFVHNLMIGKMWFEYSGRTELVSRTGGIKCVLDFKPYSWFSGTINRVEGYICDENEKTKHVLLYGKWDECLYAIRADAEGANQFASRVEKFIASGAELTDPKIELLWKAAVSTKSPSSQETGLFDKQFNFNPFTFQLNELYEYMQRPTQVVLKDADGHETEMSMGPLPPTDCRLRPDLRLYESGSTDEASAEKHRLEEKQREKARKAEAGDMEKWSPLWFEASSEAQDTIIANQRSSQNNQNWVFKNTYWNRDFSKCPDIY